MELFKDMASLLPTADSSGDFTLEPFEIGQKDWYAVVQGIPRGRYVCLLKKGCSVMMSNTPMEQRTNIAFVRQAHGDVLIGGLGIGMIVKAIEDHQDVASITVLEKEQDVIDIVCRQLSFSPKVTILCADVFTWNPPVGVKYDCIYMDIWPHINSDVYQREMKPLNRKYGHYLKPAQVSPHRFNMCWAKTYAKHDRKLY